VEGHCAAIARRYGVTEGTLRRWNRILKDNKDWEGPTHKRSQRAYIFSKEQEDALVNIVNMVIDHFHQPMTNYLFKQIATRFRNSIPPDQKQQPNIEFNASDKFIRKFRKRHKFSRRRGHLKRRPDVDESVIQQFRKEFEEKSKMYEPDHILNTDETFWRLNEFNLYTWARCGSDSIIIDGDTNEKAGFTTVATISYDNKKLPLIHVAKGKTEKVEENWCVPDEEKKKKKKKIDFT